VNGQPLLNMRHLAELVVECSSRTCKPSQPTTSDPPETTVQSETPGVEPDNCSGGALRLEFADGSMMVLDSHTLRGDTSAAMERHGLKHAMSARLRSHLDSCYSSSIRGPIDSDSNSSWPRDGEEGAGQGPGAQMRQRRRRLARR
jgi:hypothetical protein